MERKKDIFKNIIGYDDIKKTLERVIDVLNNQEKYKKLGTTIPHGLLLYGDVGLGKTTFANSILKNMINRKVFIVRKKLSDGSFMNHLEDIFKEAKKNQPSIILLDDLDKFSEAKANVLNNEEFIAVQSLIDDVKNDDVFILATANDIRILPKSLLRAGRFDIQIRISNPKEKEVCDIFKHYLKNKKIDKDVNIKNISYILGCVSCADLEKVCNQAGIYAGFKNKESIGMDELLRAALESAYNVSVEEEDDEEYALQTAYHEAGHTLIAEILEPGSISCVNILKYKSSDTKGLTIYHSNEHYFDNIQFMKNRVTSLLGGKAASEIVFNTCDAGTNSDLHRAYDIVERFIDHYCMLDFDSWIRNRDEQSEIIKTNKDLNINKLITEYYNKAKNILIGNRDKLDKLAHELCDKKILFQDDIRKIIL